MYPGLTRTQLHMRITITLLFSTALLMSGLMLHRVTAAPLDQAALSERAIAAAQRAGLEGAPSATASESTTLGEWLTRVNVEPGNGAETAMLRPEQRIFVLAMRGHVVQRIPGAPEPDKPYPNTYANITIVLDEGTGEVLWVGMFNDRATLPLAVPDD